MGNITASCVRGAMPDLFSSNFPQGGIPGRLRKKNFHRDKWSRCHRKRREGKLIPKKPEDRFCVTKISLSTVSIRKQKKADCYIRTAFTCPRITPVYTVHMFQLQECQSSWIRVTLLVNWVTHVLKSSAYLLNRTHMHIRLRDPGFCFLTSLSCTDRWNTSLA